MRAAVLCAVALLATSCSGGDAGDAGADGAALPADAPTGAPTEWATVAPAEAGFDPERLAAIARDARREGSTCLAVVREGSLVRDWYWNGGAADDPVAGFSVTKSVTSTLVGIAQAEGALDIDDPAARYVRQWRDTPAAAVTVRDLLSNDSGREWSRTSDYTGLIGARNRTAYAVGLAQERPPGTDWVYNNAAIQTLDRVLRTATGVDTATYAAERLFEPLGMSDTRMTGDASGRSTSTAFGIESTCRDLARFGLLFQQQGRWDGEQVVPRAWVREAVGGPSQRLNRSYGLLWWLNRTGLVPGAPADAYAALGFGGQVVLVDPGSETVVVRLGAVSSDGDYSVADAGRVVTEALADR